MAPSRWILFCWALWFLDSCAAWSSQGHERIARIAQNLLYGKHSDQVRTLLHGDLVDLAGFEQDITTKYPATSSLHWHRQTPEWKCSGFQNAHLGDDAGHMRCESLMGYGAVPDSLFCALAYFFEHFAHDTLLKAYPKPKTPIGTPKFLTVLSSLPKSEQTPAHYLRWLVMLLGDLHQPLHWLKEHDFGEKIKVRYKNDSFSLKAFWEQELPKSLTKVKDEGVKKKGYVPTTAIDKDYQKRVKSWQHKLPTELFQEWAKELAMNACHEIYAAMEVNHADGKREIQNPFELTDELFEKWRALAESLTMEAGERIAFVLLDILEHRRHKAAHSDGKGLADYRSTVYTMAEVGPVAIEDFDEYEGKNEGIYNMMMAIVIVPVFLYTARWHAETGHKMKFGAQAASKAF